MGTRILGNRFQTRLQVFAAGAAEAELAAVVEYDNVVAVEVRMHFLDPVEIHDD